MRCKTCHYSLANLTEHRCPECGTPFSAKDPSTYDASAPNYRSLFSRAMSWIVAIFVAACLLIPFGFYVFGLGGVPFDGVIFGAIVVTAMLSPLVAISLLFRVWKIKRRTD